MPATQLLDCLATGAISLVGEFTWGSNATFLAQLHCADETGSEIIEAVYKPEKGEQLLWDFPPESLARREVAAYLLSEALGWGLVPPTIYRAKSPLGPGSLQWRVPHDPQLHYFEFNTEQREALRPTALFDLLANNADRKGGHILVAEGGFQLIDQGLCFHVEDKLRTVVWDFRGQPIPSGLLADLQRFKAQFAGLRASLAGLLSEAEIAALESRLTHLLHSQTFPQPPEDRRAVPYPLV